MRKLLFWVLTAVLMTACGNRRMSEAELQHKIDSVNALEVKRQLALNGIKLKETSPFEMFYDSLEMQALPLSYSEDYVNYLPGFTSIPQALKIFLDLEGRESPKVIALPETVNSRLVLLAADLEDGDYELWLYSLDNDFMPVDKLLIYEPSRFVARKLKMDSRDVYFSITSFYEINVVEYADENDQTGQLSTYVVDDSRMFVEKKR